MVGIWQMLNKYIGTWMNKRNEKIISMWLAENQGNSLSQLWLAKQNMTKATVIKLRLSLCHTANSHWPPTLHMVMYMFPRYSPHSPHPLLPPLCLQCFWTTEAIGVDSLLVAPFPSSSPEWATCILLFPDMAVIQTTAYCLVVYKAHAGMLLSLPVR